MELNATLFGQMITFILFVWFTVKFVWPPIQAAMQVRENKIAEGLQAAQKNLEILANTERKVMQQLEETKLQAGKIIEEANQRAVHIIEETKAVARKEGARLIASAQHEIAEQTLTARSQLRKEIGKLTLICVERLLNRTMDDRAHQALVDELVDEL